MNAATKELETGYLCPHCGEELPDPEGDYADYVVYCSDDGKDYHEECFDDVGFHCGVCEEYFLDANLHYLAVVEPVGGIRRGVYRITGFPFHGGSIIGSDLLFPDCLCRDGHLTGNEPDEYPVCLLCPGCAAKRGVRKQIKEEAKRE